MVVVVVVILVIIPFKEVVTRNVSSCVLVLFQFAFSSCCLPFQCIKSIIIIRRSIKFHSFLVAFFPSFNVMCQIHLANLLATQIFMYACIYWCGRALMQHAF